MLERLKISGRFNTTVLLAVMSAICFGLSLFRCFFSGTNMFLFLNWNLFLAFVPWAFSSLIIIYPVLQRKKLYIVLLMLVWLLFFPNAPYILTDLFHLKRQLNMPVWFDMVLIVAFAWTGLLFGFLSLIDIERCLRVYVSKRTTILFSTLLLFIGSFGIYLGRYLRWNSWDVIREPMSILYDIGDRFMNPFSHPRTWGVTLAMGLLLNMIYWSLKVFKSER